MKVELLYFSLIVKNNQVFLDHLPQKSRTIDPGKWKSISLVEGTKVTIFCTEDGEAGKVIVRDPNKKLNAFIGEGCKEKPIRELNIELPQEVVGKQQISIAQKIGLSDAALIVLSPENNSVSWNSSREITKGG